VRRRPRPRRRRRRRERHAFDADHIAAIDNTTRKLMADGGKPKSVGFWFAMSHSMMELVVAVLVIAGTHAVGALLDDDSPPDMPWAWPAH
jgi:high-affinity nickel-transport protein